MRHLTRIESYAIHNFAAALSCVQPCHEITEGLAEVSRKWTKQKATPDVFRSVEIEIGNVIERVEGAVDRERLRRCVSWDTSAGHSIVVNLASYFWQAEDTDTFTKIRKWAKANGSDFWDKLTNEEMRKELGQDDEDV